MTEETASGRRLHPGTLVIRFVKQVPEFVIGLPAIVGLASDAGIGRFILIAALGAGLAATVALLIWLRFRYWVGEGEIIIESGVLNRQRRVIPFDRIQDIDIEQRLLARMLGLAKVRIETGGAAKDEGNLDAVSLAEAHRLRELLHRRQGSEAPGGEPEAPDQQGEPVLFRMDGRRLLLAGLFNFSLFYLAAIFGAAFQYFDQLIEPMLGDPDRWSLPSREQAARYGVYVTLAAGFAIVLLSIVTGLLRTIARDYRFRLSLAPNGFRRRRGLLTLSEVLIPIARVQVAILETGIVRKPLGWWSLDLQTLSADAHQSGQQDAAPFARIEEILPILERAGIDQLPPEDSYLRVSRRSVLRRYLAGAAPLALASLFAALLAPVALLLLVPILLGSILVIPLWRRHRYSLGEHSLFVREGLFRPRLWIMPYHRMQSVSVRRGPLQRRLRLATLEVDTAGASAFRSLSLRDLEDRVADALAVHLAEQYRAARAERLHQAR